MTTALEDILHLALKDACAALGGIKANPDAIPQTVTDALRAYAEAPEPGELVKVLRQGVIWHEQRLDVDSDAVEALLDRAADRIEALERAPGRDGVLEEAARVAESYEPGGESVAKRARNEIDRARGEMVVSTASGIAEDIRALKSPAHPHTDGWRVPEGWKLVPVSMSEDMIRASVASIIEQAYVTGNAATPKGAIETWRVILSAAPPPPNEGAK